MYIYVRILAGWLTRLVDLTKEKKRKGPQYSVPLADEYAVRSFSWFENLTAVDSFLAVSRSGTHT